MPVTRAESRFATAIPNRVLHNAGMKGLSGLVLAFLIFGLVAAGIKLLYVYRASAMRALAGRFGFQYSQGDPKIWRLPKGHRLPTSFPRLKGFPVSTLNSMWNMIEGERNGIRILIVDSTLSMGGQARGRYSTLILAQTNKNPFEDPDSEEEITHSNGWTALYRLRFWQIPWTLSTQRIEDHINNLKA
jgi:hypothetical protein